MNHKQSCIDNDAKMKKLRGEYAKKWPNYCRKCHGVGGFYSTYDPSPSGVSLSSGYMVDFDTCPECTDKGICPRCGEKSLNDDGDKCSSCGFEATVTDGIPPEHECYCWEDEMLEDKYDWWA